MIKLAIDMGSSMTKIYRADTNSGIVLAEPSCVAVDGEGRVKAIGKDAKNALKRSALCAKWNHLFCNLMGIHYDEPNRQDYYNTLHTFLRSSNQREVFGYICEVTAYDQPCTKCAVARIVERAFGLDIIKRNTYDQIFAKVAFSELISAQDKEKLLHSKKKEAIVSS